ncbi:MAG: DUF2442 domain-containing protein [Candidatus Omnitrophica bacterium]|nr:DUF2442 domain-containing protein [Candidatus Omnitrophota bacterium]MDE2009664.1 DUF2442 domain-containing protein [Candidatus Omnitrophota bacterium]MDE2214408.1 DUF2442 domain-containing protein [Candidatus Omnitrophota bacterium]MDE2231548.1 DUF2442 domain-containing protein [Candidatus Omnitrophota bacterium]
MKAIHKIQKIDFSGSQMRLKVDGKEVKVNLTKTSSRLLKASKKERETYQISPSGYGIHWPLIDEDLSVDSLLGSKRSFDHPMTRLR